MSPRQVCSSPHRRCSSRELRRTRHPGVRHGPRRPPETPHLDPTRTIPPRRCSRIRVQAIPPSLTLLFRTSPEAWISSRTRLGERRAPPSRAIDQECPHGELTSLLATCPASKGGIWCQAGAGIAGAAHLDPAGSGGSVSLSCGGLVMVAVHDRTAHHWPARAAADISAFEAGTDGVVADLVA